MKIRKRIDPHIRLMQKIAVKSRDECWLWTGGIGSYGYGIFWLDGKNLNSQRAAYLLLVGPVAADKVVCHSCDVPACCNPKHLWLGTQGENVRDCNNKGRARGHFYGQNHPRHTAKLTPDKVRKAREMFASGISQSEIARRWKLDTKTISCAIRRKTWAHVL